MDINSFFPHAQMTTLEIAQIAGKRHDHVLRDTELMFARLGLIATHFWGDATVPTNNGGFVQQPYYSLPKNLTLTLAGSYETVIRNQIIRAWIELEHRVFTRVTPQQIQDMYAATGVDVELSRSGGMQGYTLNLEAILMSTTPYARQMSTLEIATVTGKRHDNVLRDCRTMFSKLNIDERVFQGEETYVNGRGGTQTRPVFNLPRELALTMVTGYDVREMYAIVNRWLELSRLEDLTLHIGNQLYHDKVEFCLSF